MLISIRPNFADAILSGTKTVEVRRLRPAVDPGTVAYVYASAPRKAMLGFFQIESVVTQSVEDLWDIVNLGGAISQEYFDSYLVGRERASAIMISEARPLARPIELPVLRTIWPGFHPPQSFRYLTNSDADALSSALSGME